MSIPKIEPTNVYILRQQSNDFATIGVLIIDGFSLARRLFTLEKPWKNNSPFESCIPAGNYHCKRFHSPLKNIDTFLVENVKGRRGIMFHAGNSAIDTTGCILLGLNVDSRTNKILQSREAFDQFMQYLKDNETFKLQIFNAY